MELHQEGSAPAACAAALFFLLLLLFLQLLFFFLLLLFFLLLKLPPEFSPTLSIMKRCNLNIDCPDSSDEMNCTYLEKPTWYLTGVAPPKNRGSKVKQM